VNQIVRLPRLPANWSRDAFAGEYDGVPWNDV